VRIIADEREALVLSKNSSKGDRGKKLLVRRPKAAPKAPAPKAPHDEEEEDEELLGGRTTSEVQSSSHGLVTTAQDVTPPTVDFQAITKCIINAWECR